MCLTQDSQDLLKTHLCAAVTMGRALATAAAVPGALNLGPGTAASKNAFLPSAFAACHLILASTSSTVVAACSALLLSVQVLVL